MATAVLLFEPHYRSQFCPFLPSARPPVRANDDFDDDAEDDTEGMPLPDWDDPDWEPDGDEPQPEQGDFWFDSNEEEDVL